MPDGLIISLLAGAVLLGVGSAAFLVMRSPKFWSDVVSELALKAWPEIKKIITKPESEEVRKARQQCERMGGKWDPFRKKCNR